MHARPALLVVLLLLLLSISGKLAHQQCDTYTHAGTARLSDSCGSADWRTSSRLRSVMDIYQARLTTTTTV